MAILFAYQLVLSVAPWLGQIMPWGLTSPLGSNDNSITLALALGRPVESIVPIVANLVWCVLFVAIAIWRFKREEF